MTQHTPIDPMDIALAIHAGDWKLRRPITGSVAIAIVGSAALKDYKGEVDNVLAVLRAAGVEIVGDAP
jgi:hypothetical protein